MCPEIRKNAELSKGPTPFLLRFWNTGLRLVRGGRLGELGSLVYHFTNGETEALLGDPLPGFRSRRVQGWKQKSSPGFAHYPHL